LSKSKKESICERNCSVYIILLQICVKSPCVQQIIPYEKMVKSGHLGALQAEMQPKLSESFLM